MPITQDSTSSATTYTLLEEDNSTNYLHIMEWEPTLDQDSTSTSSATLSTLLEEGKRTERFPQVHWERTSNQEKNDSSQDSANEDNAPTTENTRNPDAEIKVHYHSDEGSDGGTEATSDNGNQSRLTTYASMMSKTIEIATVCNMISAPIILGPPALTPTLAGIFFFPGLHKYFHTQYNLDKKGVLAAGATLTLSALTDSFKQFPAAKNLLSISCAIGQAIITYGFGLNRPEKAPWLEKHGYLFILAATAADAIQYNKDVVSVFHDSYNDSNFSHVINALWCLTFIFKLASDQELHKKVGGALSNCSFFCKEQSWTFGTAPSICRRLQLQQ